MHCHFGIGGAESLCGRFPAIRSVLAALVTRPSNRHKHPEILARNHIKMQDKAMTLSYSDTRKKLDQITAEMLELIRKYDLDAASPFDVVKVARTKITDQNDYIRFLELSLEGRIYGEYGDALQKQIDEQAKVEAAKKLN